MQERILLYCDGKTHWFSPDDISSLQGNGSYTLVTLSGGEVMRISKNMKKLFASFPATCKQFYRVQKSFIVNLNRIEYLYSTGRYKFMLHLQNGSDLPISTNVRKQLLEIYGFSEKDAGGMALKPKSIALHVKNKGQTEKDLNSEDFIMISL